MVTWVGLTGGIASGKSTVAKMLREKGVPVVDADVLAREAVAPGTDGLAAIVVRFGTHVVVDGVLDRAALADIIFSDEDARRDLNAIVHPAVAQLAQARAQALAEDGHEVMIYEVPLLFEGGLEALMTCTILVAVDEDTQLERVMARDDLSEVDALARIRSQMSLADKRERATFVIENGGPLSETRRAVDQVWSEVTELIKSGRGLRPG